MQNVRIHSALHIARFELREDDQDHNACLQNGEERGSDEDEEWTSHRISGSSMRASLVIKDVERSIRAERQKRGGRAGQRKGHGG